MSSLINCPECNQKILSRMGTICPNCGFTVGYFNGEKRRKSYGKLFALNVFAPFISFVSIIFGQINLYIFVLASLLTIFLAFKACPIHFKEVFASRFEKGFFWFIWLLLNFFLLVLIVNTANKIV